MYKIYLSINVQYERVANISDVVRRGLGMLPQQAEQAIFEKSQESELSKMSKLVHVYTACEFVKRSLFTLLAGIVPNSVQYRLYRKSDYTESYRNTRFYEEVSIKIRYNFFAHLIRHNNETGNLIERFGIIFSLF